MSRPVVPRLSIIVASVRPGDNLQSALCDLTHDGPASDVEVIFAERLCGAPSRQPVGVSDCVVRIGVPDAATLPRLLGTALEYARGDIIAITDTRCEMEEGWVAALLRAHKSAFPMIGEAVEPGCCGGWVGWAAYLTGYGQFIMPLTGGIAAELPGKQHLDEALCARAWSRVRERRVLEDVLVPAAPSR